MINRFKAAVRCFTKEKNNTEVAHDLHQMMPGMILEQIAAILMENVNVLLMGFISSAAIAGVGQINTVNNVLMNVFAALAVGGTVVTSRFVGGKQTAKARQSAFSALVLGLIVSCVLTIIMFLFREQIVYLLFGKAEQEVINNSVLYFSITILSPPLWFLYYQCCGIMRSAGDAKNPMIASVVLNVSGIGLNILLTLVLGMGVKGAALSYLLSVLIAGSLAFIMIIRTSFEIRPAVCSSSVLKENISSITSIAIPSAGENLMFNGSRIILQIFLAGMGTAMISANSVFNSVNGIFNVLPMSVYSLTVPIIGRCAGRGDRRSVSDALGYLTRVTFAYTVPVAILHAVAGVPGSLIFTRDPEVVKIAANMLLIYAPFAVLQHGSFILPNGFKAVDDAKYPMMVSSITAWGIRVFGTWLLGVHFGMGAYAIIISQSLDTLVRASVYFIRYKKGTWLNKWELKRNEAS